MDSNDCDTNHLDADVRLPPRKRLLAGLKKQSCSESQSTSQCSQENNVSPSLTLSIAHSPLSEFDVRLNKLLKSYKNGSNMSPEEIAVAADLAAAAAAKAAEAARADAEEKAAIAAKAVAAAKSALDMVASVSEEASSSRHQRKNKLKKHVPVQMLYKKNQPVGTCGTDEELARSLHRAMNSSPRILKPSPVSGSKNRKHKKPRTSPTAEKNDIPNDTSLRDGNGKMPSTCNGDVIEGMDYEGSREDACNGKVDEDMLKSSKADELEMDSVEAESSHSKGKNFESSDDMCNSGRKRGRIKQKKLPLSFCNSKDQANPKDDLNLTNSFLTRARTDISTACHVSLPSADKVTPMEIAPTWKCLDFKVPQCIKQDKFVQS